MGTPTSPCVGHLWLFYPGGRLRCIAPVRQGPTAGGLAGSSLRPVSGRGQNQTGIRREHAHLEPQRVERRFVSAAARGRPGGYRASGAVHDWLPFQSISVGQGDRNRAGGLQGRATSLQGFSGPAGRRHRIRTEAEFPDFLATRLPGAASPANWARSTFRRRTRI